MKNHVQNRAAVIAAIERGELHDAIGRLRTLAPAGDWNIVSGIDRAEQDYRLMLRYAFSAVADPERDRLYGELTARLRTLLDMIVRKSLAGDSPELYFSTLRYELMQPADTVQALIGRYRQLAGRSSLFNMATSAGHSQAAGADTARVDMERMERRIFNRVWVTFPLSSDDAAAITGVMSDQTFPLSMKSALTGALMLGSLEYFDEPALTRLLVAASGAGGGADGDVLRLRATVAALMLMGVHSRRHLSARVTSRLESLRDAGDWSATVRTVWLQYIRSLDTEAISRKMRDEFIPEMMKLRDKFPKNLADDPEALISIEENPEWEELLASSGLTDRLKELTEMQSDGADLFHGTFSALKSFAFFNDIAHWFIPFDTERTEVAAALGHDTAIGEMLGVAPFMCDSDKYSLVFSLSQVPDSQKRMMRQQLEGHSVHMAEIRNAELLPADKRRENMVNKFVQDLYRFFSLFRRKSEFVNPFVSDFNLPEVAALAPDMKDDAMLRAVGELYFRHRHYRNALSIFERIDAPGDATLYQKIGFALQKLGFYERAIAAYEKAELLAPDSLWTLRRIASLLRQTGETRRALDYYRRIETACPDDPAVALSIGHCYLDMKEYHEALHSYYKAEFMDEKSPKPLRPIAWCAFLMRDFDTSRAYYTRLLASAGPEPQDYLNMGHLCLVTGNSAEALANYKLFVAGRPISVLADALAKDRPQLEAAGIDTGLIPLIIDSILYEQQQ